MGKAKKQTIPKCSYGAACTRKGCVYTHPPKPPKKKKGEPPAPTSQTTTSSRVCLPYLSNLCTFGSGCRDRHPPDEECERLIKEYKQRPCTWGAGCRTYACLYFHPDEDAGSNAEGSSEDLKALQPPQPPQKGGPNPLPAKITYESWLANGCQLPEGVSKRVFFDQAGIQLEFRAVYAFVFDGIKPSHAMRSRSRSRSSQPPVVKLKAPPITKKVIGVEKVTMPQSLWVDSSLRTNCFHVSDPFERYDMVNKAHIGRTDVIDLHFQSLSTFEPVLEYHLQGRTGRVWVICGSGHHIVADSHQKKAQGREGVLYGGVQEFLDRKNIRYQIGKDNRGNICGSLYVAM